MAITGSYLGYCRTSFSHALTTILRHKRILLAGIVTLTPVIIPLALAFLSTARYADDGYQIFVRIVEQLYLKAMAPLLALFFGSMLVGEDVESQTISYLLTRPLPRSALLLGKFGAYLVIAGVMLLVSVGLTYGACTPLGGLDMDAESLKLLFHYVGICLLAITGYGALCTFLGAIFKRPVVIGVLFLFGWQRIANIIPGLVDFLTIEKYLTTLLPALAVARDKPVVQAALMEFEKDPLEMNDLASNRRQRRRMKRLFAKLLELQKQTGDQLDLKSIYPELL